MRLIWLISLTQLSGWLWAFGPHMTCAAVCKQYISTGKSAHVATPSPLLWPWMSSVSAVKKKKNSALWRQDRAARSIAGTQCSSCYRPLRCLKNNKTHFQISLTTVFLVLFYFCFSWKLIFNHSKYFRVLQELQGVHIVDRCSAVPSKFFSILYEWNRAHPSRLLLCLWSWSFLSTLWKQVINHAICLCWHYIRVLEPR